LHVFFIVTNWCSIDNEVWEGGGGI
jgi:hypothetical protein